MTIGEKIVKLRKQAGMSQETFGEKLGISRQAVSKWENGTAQPTNENLAQIARLFDVTISSLLDDEDINMGAAPQYSTLSEEFVENIAETKDIKVHTKALKISSVAQSGAIIILAIATMVQGFTIGRLRKDVNHLIRNGNGYSSIQSQIDILRSQINNFTYTPLTPNDDFTDSSYKVVSYDRNTNIATLQFSVVPKDYTRDTQAEIVIKGSEKDYSARANMVNNLFVVDMDVYCEDNLTAYLYLTENGKTRSFNLGALKNPSSDYTLDVVAGVFDGEIKVEKSKIEIDGNISCKIGCVFKEDIRQSYYPAKATIEFYTGDTLLKEIPFTSVMNNDFIATAKHELDSMGVAAVTNDITFFEYFDFIIQEDIIKSAHSRIGIRVVVVDNHGNEYKSDVNNFQIGGEVKEVITPKPD